MLHGAAVGLALAFATQMKPVLPEDVFKWDVALVEAVKSEALPEQPPSTAVPPSKPKRVPQTTKAVIQPEKVEPAQPTVEPVQRIEQKIEPLPHEETIEPKAESVAVALPSEPVETPPVHQEQTTDVSVASVPHEPQPAQEAPQSSPPETIVSSDVKLDFRWLAESLYRRVAELKRYPNSARANGQEGKVVLKAVIRSDGHLADVSVQKSSGHAVLDAAAMEAVKLACPLHMKHAIGKPMIVVSLPIVYSLVN